MPTIFTHGFIAMAVYRVFRKQPSVYLIMAAVICSMVPDADVAAFYFGIPYEHVLGHRGITHSIFFAALLAGFVTAVLKKWFIGAYSYKSVFAILFISTVLHPLTDALTNGGLGVALFAPFSNERFFFEYRPIQVSPIGAGHFFSARGWEVIKSEFIFLWIPSMVAALLLIGGMFLLSSSVEK